MLALLSVVILSTCLPQRWLRFDSQTHPHMWVEFAGSLLCSERFFFLI